MYEFSQFSEYRSTQCVNLRCVGIRIYKFFIRRIATVQDKMEFAKFVYFRELTFKNNFQKILSKNNGRGKMYF